MILSERFRFVKDEATIVSDSGSYNISNCFRDFDSNTYYTNGNTSYVLRKTVTLTPDSGGHIGIYRISYQTMQNSGTLIGVRVTAQESGGSEEIILQDEHQGTGSWTTRSFVVDRCFGRDKSVTVRVYLRTGSSSYTGSMRNFEIIYHKASYGVILTRSFTLSGDSDLMLTFTASTNGAGYVGVVVDSMFYAGKYYTSSVSSDLIHAVFRLAGGNHTISIIGLSMDTTSPLSGTLVTVTVSSLKLVRIRFADTSSRILSQYAGSFTLQAPTRKICTGTFRRAHICIDLAAYTVDAVTNLGTGTNHVKLYINNTEYSFNVYGFNGRRDHPAHGKLSLKIDAGVSYTVSVSCANSNTVVYMSAWICPWIIPFVGEYDPFDLRFPPGSTLYLLLEPLFSDPTKTLRMDEVTVTGTGVILYSHTFDIREPESSVIFLTGYGACISLASVDVRLTL